eukprot:6461954-Amphidinium_carterae.1
MSMPVNAVQWIGPTSTSHGTQLNSDTRENYPLYLALLYLGHRMLNIETAITMRLGNGIAAFSHVDGFEDSYTYWWAPAEPQLTWYLYQPDCNRVNFQLLCYNDHHKRVMVQYLCSSQDTVDHAASVNRDIEERGGSVVDDEDDLDIRSTITFRSATPS